MAKWLAGGRSGTRHTLLAGLALGVVCVSAAAVSAQQIYRWTDASGKVHFGNQPPPGTKAEAKDREKGEVEIECESTVKAECQRLQKKYGKWAHSEAYRECVDEGTEKCATLKPRAKPTVARERFVSTPTLPFDPILGDSLLCEMRCPTKCRGQVEIRADKVLKKGENYGADRYTMEVKPQLAGSAFCSASTPSTDVQLVLSVLRNGSVKAVVEGQ